MGGKDRIWGNARSHPRLQMRCLGNWNYKMLRVQLAMHSSALDIFIYGGLRQNSLSIETKNDLSSEYLTF